MEDWRSQDQFQLEIMNTLSLYILQRTSDMVKMTMTMIFVSSSIRRILLLFFWSTMFGFGKKDSRKEEKGKEKNRT